MYNIHAHLTEQDQHILVEHLKRVKPGLVVVMDNPGLAMRIKDVLPSTNVVYRRFFPGGNGDNNVHTRIDAQGWLSTYLAEIPASKGIYFYCNNEPGPSQEAFNHALSCARLAVGAGAKICALNFSVGVPEPAAWRMPEAVDFLQYAGMNRSMILLGIHEYAPTYYGKEFGLDPKFPESWPAKFTGKSYLISRYREVLAACIELGIPSPRIGITEWGFDIISAEEQWQQSLPHTAEEGCENVGPLWCNISAWEFLKPGHISWPVFMLIQLKWAWQAIYRHDPEIAGVALFCYGADPGSAWNNFDYRLVPGIHELIEAVDWSKANVTQPVVKPNAIWKAPPEGIRIRKSPISGTVIGLIPGGAQVTIHPDKFAWDPKTGGHPWVYVTYKGITGWSALYFDDTLSAIPAAATFAELYQTETKTDSDGAG
jgi:hypothetical protein